MCLLFHGQQTYVRIKKNYPKKPNTFVTIFKQVFTHSGKSERRRRREKEKGKERERQYATNMTKLDLGNKQRSETKP